MSIVLKDGNKCSQWSYVFSKSFVNHETVKHLSALPRADVLYNVFATREDNTGNPYIEGFIKLTRRHRVAFLKKLIGPVIFNVVYDVPRFLLELNLNCSDDVKEFGDPSSTKFNCFRNDIPLFKKEAGRTPLDRLSKTFPHFFAKYPELVIPFIEKKKKEPLEPTPPPHDVASSEWRKKTKDEILAEKRKAILEKRVTAEAPGPCRRV